MQLCRTKLLSFYKGDQKMTLKRRNFLQTLGGASLMFFYPFQSTPNFLKNNLSLFKKNDAKKESITGTPTGFIEFDSLTSGLQPSNLIIIAGRPGMGKTTFALDIARYVGAAKQIPVAIFSLEMSEEQLGLRMLCAEARLKSSRARTGFLAKSDWPKLTMAAKKLYESSIFIDDSPQINVLDICIKSRKLQTELKKKLGLIIIDYLQLIKNKEKSNNGQMEISEISRSLKELAKELNLPVIALSQLSRVAESRNDKRPLLSDLRRFGSIEQNADVVAFIYRDEVYNNETTAAGIAEIIISKQRNGPTGSFKVTFIKETPRFKNYSLHSDTEK